jgi:hypothetical protein
MNKILLSTILLFQAVFVFADNQTATTTPVLPPTSLPFSVSIGLSNIQLPNGWHSGAVGFWKGKCLLIAGRTNGMHGFSAESNASNFPPSAQNKVLYVIDFKCQKVWQRSLTDSRSGLTQGQIDLLSVTSPQSFQSGNTLYISGGYGVDSGTGNMNTKTTLTAIDVPGLIKWVIHPHHKGRAAKHVRQTTHPLLQVTGGYMAQTGSHSPVLLIFGQNFTGFYSDSSNGAYTQQVRTFRIVDNDDDFYIVPTENQPVQNPAYRRRDLNVVPVLRPGSDRPHPAYVAFSGVFTESEGIWTVPVFILPDGQSFMANPLDSSTFRQGMSNYACPVVGLYSQNTQDMYEIFFGGLTYGFFENGVFNTDEEIPFTNEVTTIKIDPVGVFSQYIMANEYPTILSVYSNPGNTLLFGAGGVFIPKNHLPTYSNGVLKLDSLMNKEPQVIGYIVGGIQSTVPNTEFITDSGASPYIFEVTLLPK